mmetsp:Transcript_59104/g.103918  ORF Transcript_59104/g.103918 Transcript_59104/m.103918 type:complete len:220 (+) Transcript_59104:91-750(+)
MNTLNMRPVTKNKTQRFRCTRTHTNKFNPLYAQNLSHNVLVLFLHESSLDTQSAVSKVLAHIVLDLFGPHSSAPLFDELFDAHAALLWGIGADEARPAETQRDFIVRPATATRHTSLLLHVGGRGGVLRGGTGTTSGGHWPPLRLLVLALPLPPRLEKVTALLLQVSTASASTRLSWSLQLAQSTGAIAATAASAHAVGNIVIVVSVAPACLPRSVGFR